jgi:serine-type D-Ala-D-Ala carboxypeptidase/endopeptidase
MIDVREPTTAQLDRLVAQYLKGRHNVAIAIGYASSNFQGLYLAGNVVNQFLQPMELNADTYFELGSVSKVFTTTLSAIIGAKYQPKWETQTIGDYTIDIRADGLRVGSQFYNIRLVDLANYTSGLPADDKGAADKPRFLPQPYSAAAMLGYLNTPSLQPLPPGTAYAYSNLGFSVLAQIIPLFISGDVSSDFDQLMYQWLLEPLNMYNTHFFEDIPLDQLPLGFSYSTGSQVSEKPGWPVFPAYYGAGGLVSTPGDMMTWLQFNMGLFNSSLTPVLSTTQKPSTTIATPNNDRLGLGWFLSPATRPPIPGFVSKNGALAGYNSLIQFCRWVATEEPSLAGVFVLTNSDKLKNSAGAVADSGITTAVLDIMLNVSP